MTTSNEKNCEWVWSDAWLLHAIYLAENVMGNTSLLNIIRCGDYINHSIFSFEEMRPGLQKLIAVNYASIENNIIHTTNMFTGECAALLSGAKYVLQLTNSLENALKTKTLPAALPLISAELLTEALLSKAYADYHNGK